MIFHIFMTPFAFPTFKSIARLLVTLLIFAHLPHIQFPQDLHNTAFAVVFLPQMKHGSFLLNCYTVIYIVILPNHTHHNLHFHQIHIQAYTLKCTFPMINLFWSYAVVSAIKAKSSACNFSYNTPSFISFITTSITMANNSGDKIDP